MNKLYDLKVNHMLKPLGLDNRDITFCFKTTVGEKFTVNIFNHLKHKLYSEVVLIEQINSFKLNTVFEEGKVYFWNVVTGGIKSEFSEFETAERLENNFVTTNSEIDCPKLIRDFETKEIVKARMYITGLGLYRAFINGIKVGDNYLTPFFNDYDAYVRYQTYDVTKLIKANNRIEVVLGDGWYKGRFGLNGQEGNIFGDQYLLNVKLVITLLDGTTEVIITDENWEATNSNIINTSIYDGETIDDTTEIIEATKCVKNLREYNLIPDFSPVIKNKIEIKPKLIITPKGEQILDAGQNMVGYCKFICREDKETKIQFLHGEVLQNECFYNENLRTAKAEFNYISNGLTKKIEPLFTFYGFRYIKVTGIKNVNPEDFTCVVLYSDLESTLFVNSSDEKINQLMQNALWGQRGNFIDVPTDCPQRDERLGWTADTQVFVNTACYNMDCVGFYKKFMRDMRYDQTLYYNGDIPMYSPSLKKAAGIGGAVWSDAGTIVPWNVYMAYGDKYLLSENYEMMKDYVETLIMADLEAGNKHIISWGFTFGDWLAQDGVCEQASKGGTDNTFIKTIYYMNSLNIIAKASNVIGETDEYIRYKTLADEVKNAVINEYFSKTGRLALTTQTSYILALHYEIYIDKNKLIEEFKDKLKKDFYTIKSGFTGTPLMLNVLFENGMEEEGYRILFNEKYPGWLYQVNLGATTIWERWNSILSDGTISGTNMNSLNHYAYGSVCEAIYAYVGGLENVEAGWKKAKISPKPNYRLKHFEIVFNSPVGTYEVNWRIEDNNIFNLKVIVPYGAKAEIVLPNHPENLVEDIGSGEYVFRYEPTVDYIHPFNSESYVLDLMENEEAKRILSENLPQVFSRISGENTEFLLENLMFFGFLPMFGTNPTEVQKAAKLLEKINIRKI